MKIPTHQAKRCVDAVEGNMSHEFYKIEDIELRMRFLNRLREIANGRPGDIDGFTLQGLFVKLFGEPEKVIEETAPKRESVPHSVPIEPILKNGHPVHFNVGT